MEKRWEMEEIREQERERRRKAKEERGEAVHWKPRVDLLTEYAERSRERKNYTHQRDQRYTERGSEPAVRKIMTMEDRLAQVRSKWENKGGEDDTSAESQSFPSITKIRPSKPRSDAGGSRTRDME